MDLRTLRVGWVVDKYTFLKSLSFLPSYTYSASPKGGQSYTKKCHIRARAHTHTHTLHTHTLRTCTHTHTHLATPAPLSIPSPDHLPPSFPYISDHSTLQNKSSVHYCQYAKVGLPWWSSSKDVTFQCRQCVGSIPGRELTSHMPAGQKTKTWNRSDTATNSVKDLRNMVHIEKIFLKTTLNHKIICTFVREVSQGQ